MSLARAPRLTAPIDLFIEAMLDIARLAEESPEAFAEMPVPTPVSRLDETRAVKDMV